MNIRNNLYLGYYDQMHHTIKAVNQNRDQWDNDWAQTPLWASHNPYFVFYPLTWDAKSASRTRFGSGTLVDHQVRISLKPNQIIPAKICKWALKQQSKYKELKLIVTWKEKQMSNQDSNE